MHKLLFWKCSKFLSFDKIPTVLLLIVSFSFFQNQLFSLHAFLRIYKTFSSNLHLWIHMRIFYTINCHGHWNTHKKYVHLLLQWMISKNYFYIHLFFYQRFKICINNRWCFIRISVLLKLKNLNVFGTQNIKKLHFVINITKIFIFTYLFLRFKFLLLLF